MDQYLIPISMLLPVLSALKRMAPKLCETPSRRGCFVIDRPDGVMIYSLQEISTEDSSKT